MANPEEGEGAGDVRTNCSPLFELGNVEAKEYVILTPEFTVPSSLGSWLKVTGVNSPVEKVTTDPTALESRPVSANSRSKVVVAIVKEPNAVIPLTVASTSYSPAARLGTVKLQLNTPVKRPVVWEVQVCVLGVWPLNVKLVTG